MIFPIRYHWSRELRDSLSLIPRNPEPKQRATTMVLLFYMEDNSRAEEWGTKGVIHRRSGAKWGCGAELTAVPHSGDAYKLHLWIIPGEGREKAETIYSSALEIIVPHAFRSCVQGLGTEQTPVLLSVGQTWDGKPEIHGWGGRWGIIRLHLVNLLGTHRELEQGCQEDLRRSAIVSYTKGLHFLLQTYAIWTSPPGCETLWAYSLHGRRLSSYLTYFPIGCGWWDFR